MRRSLRCAVAFGLSLAVGGCATAGFVRPVTDAERTRYRAAIDDATIARPDEMVRDLVAIAAGDPRVTWRQKPGVSGVLVVTWTRGQRRPELVGKTASFRKYVWVTVAPAMQRFCRELQLRPADLSRRLEQLLGLPPDNGKTLVVEMWAKPADLFRPCADPEIDDNRCELTARTGPHAASADHRRWFAAQKQQSYGKAGYPWTRLGYTYDWGNQRGEVGLSEFVIRPGARVTVRAVATTADYCR